MKLAAPAIIVASVWIRLHPAGAADILLAGFSGDTVYRYDGVSATVFATDAAMDGPTALAYNSAGHLLVLNEFSHNVLEFNGTTGTFISTIISSSALGAAGITDPDDMEIGPDGKLYISGHFNSGLANVAKFDATTGASLGVFAYAPPVHHTHGLAFDAGGNLYQGNVDGSLVEKFNGTTGISMGTFAGAAGMTPIGDLAFGPGRLYVTTTGGSGVARFDGTTGSFIDYLPSTAGEAYWGIMVDSGVLYLSDLTAGTLRKFDAATGAFIGDVALGGGAFDMIAMPVPEPARAVLSLLGLMVLATGSRRRKRKS